MDTNRRNFLRGAALAAAATAYRRAEALPFDGFRSVADLQPALLKDNERYTRGVGVYPGEWTDYCGPMLTPAAPGVRNLALLKPAYQSSSYDYNLTAQLVTDGIKATELPRWFACSVQGGILPKEQREVFVNHDPVNPLLVTGTHITVDFHLAGGGPAPEVDRIDLITVTPLRIPSDDLRFQVSTSPDGHVWKVEKLVHGGVALPRDGYPPDVMRAAQALQTSVQFAAPLAARFYRFELLSPEPQEGVEPFSAWKIGQISLYRSGAQVQIGGPYHFTSAWKSAGLDEEWVYVDLLSPCVIESVKLYWIASACRGSIQVSNDAETWRDVKKLSGATPLEEIRFAAPVRARYVRVLMLQPSTEDGYVLSEFEVYGHGGLVASRPDRTRSEVDSSKWSLSSSFVPWRLQRDSEVRTAERDIATVGFRDAAWLSATVPGTILTSYQNAGALPDPNFGRNQLYLSDSFFYADFWYRTEFPSPATESKRVWLCVDGVNWKAEVFLNGEQVGRVDGAFMRGRFDITAKLHPGGPNALAIRVERNATPGSVHQKTYETPSNNGGGLGADNPTFHASVGWDWIPTVRGRNTGLWNDVWLHLTSDVTIEDPLVQTALVPLAAAAEITVSAQFENHSSRSITGRIVGNIGSHRFSRSLTLAAGLKQTVTVSSANDPSLRIYNPELWWPNGYGEPHLHDAEIAFIPDGGGAVERLQFKAGLREVKATEEGGKLRLYVNGARIIPRGGNWGFSEVQLRYRSREYDAALRYHRDMNFNMVRNWVGQIGEDAFYEACDRHGILVWQDFWLANPYDGVIPNDNAMFLANARDLVHRIRRHACVAIYCGRNEGFPPEALDEGIREILRKSHPDLHYIGSSADGPVSGHGPYQTLSVVEYFRVSDDKLHSEIGAPNIPTIDSVRSMIPKDALWPQGLEYGLHDFTLDGAQGSKSFLALIENVYGGATNAKEWLELAQFLNFDTYRAMFEAQSRDRMGVLLWMSHPCWPSFVWQTYDYYLEPTAAYYACKKACEPVHIQWNPLTGNVEVVNYSAKALHGVEVRAEVLQPDGQRVWDKTFVLYSPADSTSVAFKMEFPKPSAPIHFLRLTLQCAGLQVSSNTYIRGNEEGNLRHIRSFRNALLMVVGTATRKAESWQLSTSLKNNSTVPALLTRLKVVAERDRERILPALHDDNFFILLAGESRTIQSTVQDADTRGQRPVIAVEGFNISVDRHP